MATCPKCGYTRSVEDTTPEYECPKCGIVYAKYISSADPVTIRQRPAQLSTKSLVVFSARYKRLLLFAAACGFILIVASLAALHYLGTPDHGGLRARYDAYTAAVQKLEFDKAHQY